MKLKDRWTSPAVCYIRRSTVTAGGEEVPIAITYPGLTCRIYGGPEGPLNCIQYRFAIGQVPFFTMDSAAHFRFRDYIDWKSFGKDFVPGPVLLDGKEMWDSAAYEGWIFEAPSPVQSK